MLSPSTRTASASALKAARLSAPTALPISVAHASAGFCQAGSLTKAAVGALWPLSATRVRPGRMRSTVSLPAGHERVAADDQVGGRHADAGGADRILVLGYQHVAPGGAAL